MRGDATGRLHALLRRCLPGTLNRAHGREMERVFRERLRDEHPRGRRHVVALWLREAWDLAGTGARLRVTRRSTGAGTMGGWMEDLKSALRSLRRSPGFSAFAAGTLALGVGATITFAAFLDRVILRPVDFPHSDRIVMVWRAQDSGFELSPDLETRDRVRAADVFDGVAAVGWGEFARSTDEGPRMLVGGLIDEALPKLAGVAPLLGRYFAAADLAGAGAAVVVLSEGYWKRAYGGDRDVLGRVLRLEGQSRTIVGVAPDALRAPNPSNRAVDVWLPLPADGWVAGNNIYARLREGVGVEQAQERVQALDLTAADNDAPLQWKTRLMPVEEFANARFRDPLKAVGVAVLLLLLIACINVANLLLARGDLRRRETAVRAALGAGRLRLAREIFAESALLALVGSAVGLALAVGVLTVVRRLRPEDLHILEGVYLAPGVTLAAVAASVGTALAFGLLPLLSRVRTRPGTVLSERSGTADGGALALRRALLVGEVALSFALLAAAVQITTELSRVRSRDPGLAADELLAVSLRLPEWRFADDVAREDALERIRGKLRTLPDVRSVTVATGAPPDLGVFFGAASAEGQPATPDGGKAVLFFGNSVDPGYFSATGQSILEGRPFAPEDAGSDPDPMILGESAARKYFPDGGAVGGRFRLGDEGPWHPVIGVARDIWATGSATDPGYGQLYVPRDRGRGRSVLIRTADPSSVAERVREAVRSVDTEIPVVQMRAVAEGYRDALARERMIGALLAAFAITAALLSAVGLYGVAAQLAVRRVREFGIRISLGAERRSIFTLALRGGALTLLLGLLGGAALGWGGLRLLRAGVAGLDAAHPGAFVAAALLLSVATLLAMGLPAVRAAGTDPVEAMRVE